LKAEKLLLMVEQQWSRSSRMCLHAVLQWSHSKVMVLIKVP